MNLNFNLITAHMYGETRHPGEVMRDLGITYQHATPQSMGDCWWFWNCANMPEPLPRFLSLLNVLPHQAIGYGLSAEQASALARKDGE